MIRLFASFFPAALILKLSALQNVISLSLLLFLTHDIGCRVKACPWNCVTLLDRIDTKKEARLYCACQVREREIVAASRWFRSELGRLREERKELSIPRWRRRERLTRTFPLSLGLPPPSPFPRAPSFSLVSSPVAPRQMHNYRHAMHFHETFSFPLAAIRRNGKEPPSLPRSSPRLSACDVAHLLFSLARSCEINVSQISGLDSAIRVMQLRDVCNWNGVFVLLILSRFSIRLIGKIGLADISVMLNFNP